MELLVIFYYHHVQAYHEYLDEQKTRTDDQFHKDHQKIMVNNDDNLIFQFQLSRLFYCLLYHVPMQLENRHVDKIF